MFGKMSCQFLFICLAMTETCSEDSDSTTPRVGESKMPSPRMRRATMVDGARVLRSGGRILGETGKMKSRRGNAGKDACLRDKGFKEVDSNLELISIGDERIIENDKESLSNVGGEDSVDKRFGIVYSRKRNVGGEESVDKRFGIVYSRKRKRQLSSESDRNGVGEDKMFGIQYFRKRRKGSSDSFDNKAGLICRGSSFGFVLGVRVDSVCSTSGSCRSDCFTSLLYLILRHLKRRKMSLHWLFRFLVLGPLGSVYSSLGIRFLRDPPCIISSGIIKIFGAKQLIPLFRVDFSVVPVCFKYMHTSLLLRNRCLLEISVHNLEGVNLLSNVEITCSSETNRTDLRVGQALVPAVDKSGSESVLEPSVRNSGLALQTELYKDSLHYHSIRKRRSSLRSRRSKTPWPIGETLFLVSHLISWKKHSSQMSSVRKEIVLPGVREVSGYSDVYTAAFSRPDAYIIVKEDELSRALSKKTSNYDLDSEDEEWVIKFNHNFFGENRIQHHLTENIYELMIDAFERACHCCPDDFYDVEAAVKVCSELAQREVIEAVYGYWKMKLKKKRSALLRVFQLDKESRTKKQREARRHRTRSAKRQGKSQMAADNIQAAIQHDLDIQNPERRWAKRAVEVATAKRERAQFLVEKADRATYRATMAMKIAESLSDRHRI